MWVEKKDLRIGDLHDLEYVKDDWCDRSSKGCRVMYWKRYVRLKPNLFKGPWCWGAVWITLKSKRHLHSLRLSALLRKMSRKGMPSHGQSGWPSCNSGNGRAGSRDHNILKPRTSWEHHTSSKTNACTPHDWMTPKAVQFLVYQGYWEGQILPCCCCCWCQASWG